MTVYQAGYPIYPANVAQPAGVQVIVDILMNHMASPCKKARGKLGGSLARGGWVAGWYNEQLVVWNIFEIPYIGNKVNNWLSYFSERYRYTTNQVGYLRYCEILWICYAWFENGTPLHMVGHHFPSSNVNFGEQMVGTLFSAMNPWIQASSGWCLGTSYTEISSITLW